MMPGEISISTLGYKDNSFRQEQSFIYALQKGVSWVDAPFWSCNGDGLEIISQYLQRLSEFPKLKRNLKLVAKGGFSTGRALHHFSGLDESQHSTHMLGIDSLFSLNQDFILSQLDYTFQRLSAVGCHTFLIYIPDIIPNYGNNDQRFLDDLCNIFTILEVAVQRGDLQQFGLSGSVPALTKAFSNTLSDSLRYLTEEFPHFNVIQVPFNCSELNLMFPIDAHRSCLSMLKSFGLTVWTNRPITARVPKGYLKMREYPIGPVKSDDDMVSILNTLESKEVELRDWVKSLVDERQFERDFNVTADFDLSFLLKENYSRITSFSHWENWWSDMVSPQVERVTYSISKSNSPEKMAKMKEYSTLISELKETFSIYFKQRSNDQLVKYRDVLDYIFSPSSDSLHDIWLSFVLAHPDISLMGIGITTKEHLDMIIKLLKRPLPNYDIPQVTWDNVKSYVDAKKLVVIE
jgi:hypothetical protein